MHLQSLELFGFKSFADKTSFNFHQGVTAIVGPNGCGKSNVCDAIRWVLGEQSAKSLRGGEMADVIFNGTDSRKPLGFAEVSLTFTDCAAELGVDWHEVRVTRRVYRDGNSEYFLNKTTCRLKDIHNLFADTGVGRSAYSIMEQGKIDLILSSRPEDRRSVFEEAAGITRYKAQKKEALRKLEGTEANLLRISDIIKEVKRQIGSLQRQAGKARRYQALHSDLQVLETHFSYRKLQALDAELAGCAAEIERVTEAENQTRHAISEGETRLGHLRAELDSADQRITIARGKLQQLETELSTHRQRIEFNEQRGAELLELIERSSGEIATAEAKLRDHEQEIESASGLVEETARLLAQKKQQLDQLGALAAARRNAREDAEQQWRELQMNLSRDELRLGAISNDERELAERRDSTQRDLSSLGENIAAATAGREQLQTQVLNARTSHQSEQQSVEQLLARLRACEEELREQQGASAVLEKQLSALHRAIAEKESRHDVLRQLNAEGEGLVEGSQALLKSGAFEFAGALAAQLDVAQEFVAAIEAALGRNLQALVLSDPTRAAEIVHWLRTRELGQAVLLLKDTDDSLPGTVPALPPNAIGWAAEKVKAPDALGPVVQRLLGNVALFATIEDALRARDHLPGIATVTRSGEFISREGVLFAGNSKVRGDSLLERKTRIAALAQELSVLRAEASALEEQRRAVESQIASLQTQLQAARHEHEQAHHAHAAAVRKLSDLEREQQTAEHDFELLHSEYETLTRQIASANMRLSELHEQRTHLEAEIARQSGEIAGAQAKRDEAARLEQEAAGELAEARVAAATSEQKHQALLAQRAPMLARRDELTELIAARSADIGNYHARLKTQAAETEAAREAIQQQSEERAKREAEIDGFVTERAGQVETINAREAALRDVRNQLSELQEKRGAYSVRQTQLQLQREHLLEHVTHRYQLDLRQFAPDIYAHEKVLRAQLKRAATEESSVSATTEEDLQKLIAELTRQLDNMGPVNLDAVQEYDELEERYRFLETQNNDLTNSKRELLEVIARINATTQKLFAETFAQVRINFREMFAELFGGGRADLQLLDEGDALNCGIEIIAKPPGKQLQSVSLLSGGERTMTAVALLFAIYMVRPSPFCVLDEMDAPLDESNINRFIRVLDRFVQQSQFIIIITHNKRTIAKADVLYGVTMEERGVSKLVGMKLTPAQRTEAEHSNGNGARQFEMAQAREQTLVAAR
ncbi:MAG: chromosome segregation protein SMC [Verrucomicrobia bacterium]|nr:chromosome segregation protein SMC [Verrucomicrobiota bacterium]